MKKYLFGLVTILTFAILAVLPVKGYAGWVLIDDWLYPGEVLTLNFSTDSSVILSGTSIDINYDTLICGTFTGLSNTDSVTTNLYDGSTLLASNTGQHENALGGEKFTWVQSAEAGLVYVYGNPTIIPFNTILDGTIDGKLNFLLTSSTPVYIEWITLSLGEAYDEGAHKHYALGDEVVINSHSIAFVPEFAIENFIINLGITESGLEDGLLDKAAEVQEKIDAGNIRAACKQLEAMIHQTEGQRHDFDPPEEADELIEYLQDIQNLIGC